MRKKCSTKLKVMYNRTFVKFIQPRQPFLWHFLFFFFSKCFCFLLYSVFSALLIVHFFVSLNLLAQLFTMYCVNGICVAAKREANGMREPEGGLDR